MIAQPTYLFGLSAWTKTASTASSTMSTVCGTRYQAIYWPSSTLVTPRMSWMTTPVSIAATNVENSTPVTASVLGTI
jgi:hypothetical protein